MSEPNEPFTTPSGKLVIDLEYLRKHYTDQELKEINDKFRKMWNESQAAPFFNSSKEAVEYIDLKKKKDGK